MLKRYPEPENWHRVHFSDEVHWGVSPQGSLYITRRPGERYCFNCLQLRDKNQDRIDAKNLKRVHAWAAISHNFKSALTFYDISSNTNGKIT